MKIPESIIRDIHKCAELYALARNLEQSIDNRLYELGFDTSDKLRCGDGNGLDELQYGNIPNYTKWSLEFDGRNPNDLV
jgi:hypothetical protein